MYININDSSCIKVWQGEVKWGLVKTGRDEEKKDFHFASSRALMLSTDEGLTNKVASCPARDNVHAEGMLVTASVKLSSANL